MDSLPEGLRARRLRMELALADALLAANTDLLFEFARQDDAGDDVLHWRLTGTSMIERMGRGAHRVLDRARIAIRFPRFFPFLPIEIAVLTPVLHPNICPHTGLACLFETYRPDENLYGALAVLQRMLSWTIWNEEVHHVVQPAALAWVHGMTPGRVQVPLPFVPVVLPNDWKHLEGTPRSSSSREFLSDIV